ncbi:MAG TPA: Fic family protein [Gallionella sp.]|nr:Fic family protein [Gallionella sp.]
MDIKDFQSGEYRQQYQYQSFLPARVNHAWSLNNADLLWLLSQADRKLGELNAFSQLVPDVDFFIRMHISKEATTSSRIEGTQTNIEEALQKIENIAPEKRDDWEEVQNYVQAMNQAIASLERLPLSGRLLKETHRTLLQGVRGAHKLPGEFRSSQNWIGGASLKSAVFIPPHHEDVPDLMADLERFLNDQSQPVPDLIKIGIAHYQFETIHPFLDGNGRIGRLLITLYLVSTGLLVKPSLYLSAFFEQYRQIYYDNLSRARTHNDLIQWLKFFLEGIWQTSENSIQTFKAIIALRAECEREVMALGKKTKLAQAALHLLYSKPVVDGQDFAAGLEINISTALRLIDDLMRLGILRESTGQKRNRVFVFQKYVALFE